MKTRARLAVADSIDRADAVSAFLEVRLYEFNAAATGRADGMGLCFTVEDGGRIVAGAAGFSWAGFAQVRELWVDEAYRRQGLGTELMAAAEREAARRGCVELQVTTFSFQAPEFYRRLGFEEVARVPGHQDGYDSIYLVKPLRRDRLA
jgi:ribosomal protein S18 acetylase RimI-like enzyme